MAISSIQANNLSLISALDSSTSSSSSTPSVSSVVSLALTAQAQRLSARAVPTDQAEALGGLYERLQNLHVAGAALNSTGLINNRFAGSIATSSDSTIVSGQISAGAAAGGGAAASSYAFTVSQLAAAQINTGNALTSSSASSVAAGSNSFTLTQNGASQTINYTATHGESNFSLLSNIASAINNQAPGVSASVVSSSGSGSSRLVLSASDTGTQNAFTLADSVGDGVAITGINATSTSASNASYTLNGVAFTSSSNTISLDNTRVSATFNKVSSSPTTLTVGSDTASLRRGIDQFVASFNDLTSFVADRPGYFRPGLAETFKRFASRNENALSAVGVTLNSSGQLKVNSEKLNTALTSDYSAVQSAFGGYSGLATRSDLAAENLHSRSSSDLLKHIDVRDSKAPGLEILRESFLHGSIIDLIK